MPDRTLDSLSRGIPSFGPRTMPFSIFLLPGPATSSFLREILNPDLRSVAMTTLMIGRVGRKRKVIDP